MNFAEDKRVLCAAGCVYTDRRTSNRFLTRREQTGNKRRHCPSNLLSFRSGREEMPPIYDNSQQRRRRRGCRERIPPNASATKACDSQGVETHNVTPRCSRERPLTHNSDNYTMILAANHSAWLDEGSCQQLNHSAICQRSFCGDQALLQSSTKENNPTNNLCGNIRREKTQVHHWCGVTPESGRLGRTILSWNCDICINCSLPDGEPRYVSLRENNKLIYTQPELATHTRQRQPPWEAAALVLRQRSPDTSVMQHKQFIGRVCLSSGIH